MKKFKINGFNSWKQDQFVLFSLSLYRTGKDWTLMAAFCGFGLLIQIEF